MLLTSAIVHVSSPEVVSRCGFGFPYTATTSPSDKMMTGYARQVPHPDGPTIVAGVVSVHIQISLRRIRLEKSYY